MRIQELKDIFSEHYKLGWSSVLPDLEPDTIDEYYGADEHVEAIRTGAMSREAARQRAVLAGYGHGRQRAMETRDAEISHPLARRSRRG